MRQHRKELALRYQAKCAHPPKIGHFVKLAPIAHRRGGLSGLQIHVNVH
jgi:hypothetical protein